MAHSTSTSHYNLPQFAATDKPAWLVDVNPAYTAIDAGMYAAQQAADAAQADATQALDDAAAASGTAATADGKGSGAISSLSDAFDTTATYEAGDIVIYNNLLYRCIADVTTPGPWTGTTNWSRTTVEALINEKQTKTASLPSGAASPDSIVPILNNGTDGKASFDDLFGSLDLFKISDTLTGSANNIAGGGWADSAFNVPDVAGYTPIAYITMQTNSPTFSMIIGFDLPGRTVRIHNNGTSAISLYATARVLYVKTNAL